MDRNSKSHIEPGIMGPRVVSPADGITEMMFEEEDNPRKQVQLAWAALQVDDMCIDAWLVLGGRSEDPQMKLIYFRNALEIGRRLWNPVAEARREAGDPLVWWGFLGTRPYMRAIYNYALTWAELGEPKEARKLFRLLLKMDSNDHMGVRFDLEQLDSTAPPPP